MRDKILSVIIFIFVFSCKTQENVSIKENPPVLITNEASNITQFGATFRGEVTDEGFTATTDRGFVYSDKNVNPSVSDIKVQSGYGKGIYFTVLEKLQENTKFYFKAYATNSKGTSYGEVKNFTTLVVKLTPPNSNTDYKNIIGKTIKLGNLEIAQYAFPLQMDWQQATNSCLALGTTWRLPTLADYKLIFDNKDVYNSKFGGYEYYWSSTELGPNVAYRFLQERYNSTFKVGNYAFAHCVRSF